MITIHIWIKKLALLVLFSLLFFVDSAISEAAEPAFEVRRIGQMVSNQPNYFAVSAPEAGIFTITVSDEDHVYRVIQTEISAGESEVEWDGCSYNQERLLTQYYDFEFALYGDSGRDYSFSFRSPVVDNGQFLQFALPSSDTVYLSDPDEWFLEAKAVLNGTLTIDFLNTQNDSDHFACEKSIHQGRVEHYSFSQLAGRFHPSEGLYTVTVWENSRPETVCSFPLKIFHEASPEREISLTGNIMPDGNAEDGEIWEIMMQPSVVIDIGYSEHQTVFSLPSSKGDSLGTLHGQTQCVSVLEISGEWARIGAWNHESADYIEGWIPLKRLKWVTPNQEYGLLLDKREQTLSVFRNGKRIETLLVSTGRMEKNKLYQETSAGSFVTGLHRVDFSTNGLRFDYVIQYDGGNLLHQIPYTSNGRKDFTPGRIYLGSKASHACIRIQDEPGRRAGINAYWIWTHIPYHTRLIILDDPEQRQARAAVLSENTPLDDTSTAYNAPTGFSERPEKSVLLSFGGNIIPGANEKYYYHKNSLASLMEADPLFQPFSLIQDIFSNDDLTCLNLECVLKEDEYFTFQDRIVRYRGIPRAAELIEEASVELLCLGNEHRVDYGINGMETTMDALSDRVLWTDTDNPLCISIRGILFGFASCTEEDYTRNQGIIEQTIRSLRDQGCRYVIMQCHWGNTGDTVHTDLQTAMARACHRAGADLVVGHHPSSVQGIEMMDQMPVLYSLGDLLGDGFLHPKGSGSVIAQVLFLPDDLRHPVRIRLIPVCTDYSAENGSGRYKPVPAGEKGLAILRDIQKDTSFNVFSVADQ